MKNLFQSRQQDNAPHRFIYEVGTVGDEDGENPDIVSETGENVDGVVEELLQKQIAAAVEKTDDPKGMIDFMREQMVILKQKNRENQEEARKEILEVIELLEKAYTKEKFGNMNFDERSIQGWKNLIEKYEGDLSQFLIDSIAPWKKVISESCGWGDAHEKFERKYGVKGVRLEGDELLNALKTVLRDADTENDYQSAWQVYANIQDGFKKLKEPSFRED